MGFLKVLGVGLLQFVGALIVTFLASLVVPGMSPDDKPGLFVAIAGAAFAAGIILVGLLALRLRWLPGARRLAGRALLSVVGVYLVLIAALLLGQVREASPFLTGAMVLGIVGFHVPGWVGRS
jgi:hypothetical protein